MKNCKNCNFLIREEDKYCRNCGIEIPSKVYIIACNICTTIIVLAIIGFVVLLIASYLID